VHSSRFAGDEATYAQNVQKLLEAMAGMGRERRGARFRTVAALVLAPGIEVLTEGSCEGLILEAPRGREGFGYDPVFFHPDLEKTFAEMELSEKSEVSHRGQAFRRMREILQRLLISGSPDTRDPTG
jgi:XTP/dITP diphosphohydrolase